jgi:hypothetical protein
MKIALITGGLPRFTPDFLKLMSQLKGFESADVYMTLWSTDWASTDEQATAKIERILLPRYKLAKVKIVNEPEFELPPCSIPLSPPTEQKYVTWHYKRIYSGTYGVKWAYDLLEDKQYDLVVVFRLDVSLDRDIDLSQYDFSNNYLVCPSNGHAGFDDFKINDLLVFGPQQSMKTYCEMATYVKDLVPLADPHWADTDLHSEHWSWSRECLIGYYMKQHNIPWAYGNFNVIMNSFGRSRFTDKHYHHPIAPDPTEI